MEEKKFLFDRFDKQNKLSFIFNEKLNTWHIVSYNEKEIVWKRIANEPEGNKLLTEFLTSLHYVEVKSDIDTIMVLNNEHEFIFVRYVQDENQILKKENLESWFYAIILNEFAKKNCQVEISKNLNFFDEVETLLVGRNEEGTCLNSICFKNDLESFLESYFSDFLENTDLRLNWMLKDFDIAIGKFLINAENFEHPKKFMNLVSEKYNSMLVNDYVRFLNSPFSELMEKAVNEEDSMRLSRTKKEEE